MSNSVDPDEMAHYDHLDLCCLQKPNIIITCDTERVKSVISYIVSSQWNSLNKVLPVGTTTYVFTENLF